MRKLKIGIVGCGAIGSSLAKAVVREFAREAALCALFDLDNLKANKLSQLLVKSDTLAVASMAQLINKSELVVEAASAKFSAAIAKKTLQAGRDIVIMSVGGVINSRAILGQLALKHKCRVYIPSGAISGVDALKAAASGRIRKVTLTTRKNPASLGLGRLKTDKVLFSGAAKDAVLKFPQNINVAAVLSLAGVGADKTRVRIIASPKVHRNIHEIEIESAAGRVFTRTENVLHPQNPKTSYLAVLSAIAALRQILNPVRIGT